MERAGLSARVDAVGNLRGVYSPRNADAPHLLIGSHLDTVPNAGAYDGVLGVILGLALIEALDGRKLAFGLELIGFSEEEGIRFGVPFIGSRALIGRVDEELLNCRDSTATTVMEAIRAFGLDPGRLGEAVLDNRARAYLEFHIEQGPVLESLGIPLAIVEAIAGQTRLQIEFRGHADHAGTTPMLVRRDALAAAAEWILHVEETACSTEALVATVGRLDVIPGATNVIPGEVRASLDVRHAKDEVRSLAVTDLLKKAQQAGARRNVSVTWQVQIDQPTVALDRTLIEMSARAISRTGVTPHRMVSGAGHDAMILAECVPAVMIFLRSPGGISHNPEESVLVADVEKALEAGLNFIEEFEHLVAGGSIFK
jgi:allantoate deiminase